MRDLLVFGAMLVFLPLGLSNAFIGYLLWGWAGLIALNSYVYGFMTVLPYVQIFALVTLGSLLMHNGDKFERIEINRTTILMILFVTHGFFVALFAYPGLPRNWELFGNIAKTVLFCLLMPIFATSRYRMHALVLMVALATSFHGALDGLKFIASGGGHVARGIAKFGDNNHFALVLLMVLPLLYYLFTYSSRKIAKFGFGLALLLTAFAVVATNSRGAFIGLLVVMAWVWLRSRNKFIGVLFFLAGIIGVVLLAPESWSERMETIKSAREDASFMGRVTAWKISSAIAVANPIVGGGFRAIQSPQVWQTFQNDPGLLGFVDTPESLVSGVAAHSIWFEVLGDMGFVGLFLFVALILNAFITRFEIRTLGKKLGPSQRWAVDLSDMLAVALLAFVVSGSLLSSAYFELHYIVIIMLEVLKQLLLRKLLTERMANAPAFSLQAGA
jgi:probable O-glycosylation ligase (exosortase A-associated)